MKIKSIIFFTIFALISSAIFAKENSSKSATKLKISSTNSDKKDEDKAAIQESDFQKLFAEAESYFKAAKAWQKLKCSPKNGFLCTKKECEKRDIQDFLILDKKEQTFTRCEGKRCEQFPAEFKQVGAFFSIQTEGSVGTLIRILGDSRYKEITTVGLDAYVANGNCEAMVDD